mmetsp:Transcript_21544/g.35325  ORF Transcript_21544/g.35325 Transcript_21544/m.35325 type:complete len:202 (-) Transcript_21544:486-1091(-)
MCFVLCCSFGLFIGRAHLTENSLTFCIIIACDTACRLRPDFVVTPQGNTDILTYSIAFMNIMPTFFNEELECKKLPIFTCKMRRRFVIKDAWSSCMRVRPMLDQHFGKLHSVRVASPRNGCTIRTSQHHFRARIRGQPFCYGKVPPAGSPLQRIQTVPAHGNISDIGDTTIWFQTGNVDLMQYVGEGLLGTLDIVQGSTRQ